jgi:hypothetical protein
MLHRVVVLDTAQNITQLVAPRAGGAAVASSKSLKHIAA